MSKCNARNAENNLVCCLDADHGGRRQTTLADGKTVIVCFHTAGNGYSWGEFIEGRCCSRCYYVETSSTEEGWTRSKEKDVCHNCSTSIVEKEPSISALVKDFLKSVFLNEP